LSRGQGQVTNEEARRTNSRSPDRTIWTPRIVNRLFAFASPMSCCIRMVRKKRRGRILFRDPAPSIRFLKIRFGHRITTFVIAKFFEAHKLRSSLGLPFLHPLQELRVCAIRCRPVACRHRESRRRFSWWPTSTLFLEDRSSVELNNTRVPYDNCGL
jgi:hypothetical protein